jgi:hypothetical protein
MRRLAAILLLQLCFVTVVLAQRKRAVDRSWDKYITKVFYDTGKNAGLQQIVDADGHSVSFYDLIMEVAKGRNSAFDISGRPVILNEKIKAVLTSQGQVHRYVLFGEWVYDEKVHKTVIVPLLIGPYDSSYAKRDGFVLDQNKQMDCSDQIFQPVFFVKYAALKPVLQRYKVRVVSKKDAEPMTNYLENGDFTGEFGCVHRAGNGKFEQAKNGWMKQ